MRCTPSVNTSSTWPNAVPTGSLRSRQPAQRARPSRRAALAGSARRRPGHRTGPRPPGDPRAEDPVRLHGDRLFNAAQAIQNPAPEASTRPAETPHDRDRLLDPRSAGARGQTGATRRVNPRSLVDREQDPLGAGRHRRRRSMPNLHRQWPPDHGHPPQRAAIGALRLAGVTKIAAANRHPARDSNRPLALLGTT